MIVTREKYGCDADGNRGVYQYNAELDESDTIDVQEQIISNYDPDKTIYTIYMEDLYGNEFEFQEDIREWFTPKEIEELNKEFDS